MDDFHRGLDLPIQAVILRQTQDVIDPFLFAPRHQLVIGESAVPPNRDPHLMSSLPRKVDLVERSIRRGEPPVSSRWRHCAMSEPVLATLYPAWRASRVQPVEALRHE